MLATILWQSCVRGEAHDIARLLVATVLGDVDAATADRDDESVPNIGD